MEDINKEDVLLRLFKAGYITEEEFKVLNTVKIEYTQYQPYQPYQPYCQEPHIYTNPSIDSPRQVMTTTA